MSSSGRPEDSPGAAGPDPGAVVVSSSGPRKRPSVEPDTGASSVEPDPAALAAYFGPAWPSVERYAALLRTHGVERGLIGPAEVPRLWTRHMLNSAALAPFLPSSGTLADVGSGAGLPGVVLALMRPDLAVHLIEPMERRVAWLGEVLDRVGLPNVTVHQGRAQDLVGTVTADVVTARAVAALDRLVPWTAPLVAPHGRLVFLKGRRAAEELAACEPWLRSAGAVSWRTLEARTGDLGEPTSVVEIVFGSGSGSDGVSVRPIKAKKAGPSRNRSRSGRAGGGQGSSERSPYRGPAGR